MITHLQSYTIFPRSCWLQIYYDLWIM